MKRQHQPVVLIIGLCLCAVCALFPPRRFVDATAYGLKNVGEVSHAFILSPDIRQYTFSVGENAPVTYWVELDGARMLAQLVLIASLTGIVALIPNLRK